MGRSSLLGTDSAAPDPAHRDTRLMGPGDSSDSGADLMGLDERDEADPNLPLDVALDEQHLHTLLAPEAAHGSAIDSAGTGERRSAGSDAGLREAADIGVDHVFTPGRRRTQRDAEAEDEDLAFVDEAQAGDPLEDEDEDDLEAGLDDELDDDPDPAGAQARRVISTGTDALNAPPPLPGQRPNPEPDIPEPGEPEAPEEDPPTEDEDHAPGRT